MIEPAALWHLSRRFAGSLSPLPPRAVDEAWVRTILTDSEATVWRQLSNPDRRHAIAVARAVDRQLVETDLGRWTRDDVLAAALLHDSGKIVSGLGTFSRVGATVVASTVSSQTLLTWARNRSGWRRRLADYRLHPALGADLLQRSGSRDLVSMWAGDHHSPPELWHTPSKLGAILKRCDDD